MIQLILFKMHYTSKTKDFGIRYQVFYILSVKNTAYIARIRMRFLIQIVKNNKDILKKFERENDLLSSEIQDQDYKWQKMPSSIST